MFPQMTLDINRAWDNEFDSYPLLSKQLDKAQEEISTED